MGYFKKLHLKIKHLFPFNKKNTKRKQAPLNKFTQTKENLFFHRAEQKNFYKRKVQLSLNLNKFHILPRKKIYYYIA